jgi:hypothetical protein
MNAFYQSWRERAQRRTSRPILRPPEGERTANNWHFIDTPQGRLVMQWNPGIEAWFDRDGHRFYAESCIEAGWTYHSRADQIGPG